MNILVTGAAGFIGFSLSTALIKLGHKILGIDNLNNYYDVKLKKDRLSILLKQSNPFEKFSFIKMDIADRVSMANLFSENHFDVVVNLAAQAGVRYSIDNPNSYIDSNITGFANILEGCRYSLLEHSTPLHLIYASSSSVYGANKKIPFSVQDNVDHPLSLYAATKKSNELLAHAYSHLYNLPVTGLRFFTVYGPWGRPDMAYFKFTKALLEGEPIDLYNYGNMKRDFTYIDDIVNGVIKIMEMPPLSLEPPLQTKPPYALYNIGNNQPIELSQFIEILEKLTGRKAIKNMLPMQPGDVPITFANIDDLVFKTGFKPETSIEDGLEKFVDWFKNYFYNSIFECELPIVAKSSKMTPCLHKFIK